MRRSYMFRRISDGEGLVGFRKSGREVLNHLLDRVHFAGFARLDKCRNLPPVVAGFSFLFLFLQAGNLCFQRRDLFCLFLG
jgi:hypothetical protein